MSLINNPTTLDFAGNRADTLDVREGYSNKYFDSMYLTDAGDEDGGGEDGADGDDGAGEEAEEKEEKGFIPGFEITFLLAAVGVSMVLLRKKH